MMEEDGKDFIQTVSIILSFFCQTFSMIQYLVLFPSLPVCLLQLKSRGMKLLIGASFHLYFDVVVLLRACSL